MGRHRLPATIPPTSLVHGGTDGTSVNSRDVIQMLLVLPRLLQSPLNNSCCLSGRGIVME
ncbi:hypothetical protein GOODEAATRI_031480, partial [Goodea atripinnis]